MLKMQLGILLREYHNLYFIYFFSFFISFISFLFLIKLKYVSLICFIRKMNLENIIQSLHIKISEIKHNDNSKVPVIFLLVGTYPGFSQIHQTPPFICDLLDKYPNISPIVLLFDPYYNNNKTFLLFLNHPDGNTNNNTAINFPEEDVWYYPHVIPSLKASYNGRVAYKYYTISVDPHFVNNFLNEFSSYLTFFWNFIGHDISVIGMKNKYKNLHMPPADCSANVYYNIKYYPQIKYDTYTNKFVLDDSMNTDLKRIVDGLELTSTSNDNVLFDKYQGFMYYYFVKWFETYKHYHLLELRIKNDDPLRQIIFTKHSTKDEWDHLKYRGGPYFDHDQFISDFMNSTEYTLRDYINEQIYQMGELLIKLEIIKKPNETMGYVLSLFMEQYYELKNKNLREFPEVFDNYLSLNTFLGKK